LRRRLLGMTANSSTSYTKKRWEKVSTYESSLRIVAILSER
jgi:hypothetical protein